MIKRKAGWKIFLIFEKKLTKYYSIGENIGKCQRNSEFCSAKNAGK
jgi:hypothetical protein